MRLLCLFGWHDRVPLPNDNPFIRNEYACRHCRRIWASVMDGWVRHRG